MAIEPGDSGAARELAARSASRRRKVTLEEIERDVPPLDSADHAQARLAMISNWGLAGMLSASMVGAQERVHREWREQHASAELLVRLKAAEARNAQLERELQAAMRRGP